jgi:hypothetical protein
MKHYLLTLSPVGDVSALVFATSVERPHEYLSMLADELRAQHVSGRMVFDLLMSNGPKSSRYFCSVFDGFQFGRMEPVEPDACLREVAAKFFSSHIEEFDTSLLTPAMRYALKRGIEILS